IVVAAAAALKPRFRRKVMRAETNQRDQNNQANGRKQNRIIESHAVRLAASQGFVKSWFPQLLQPPKTRSVSEGRALSQPSKYLRDAFLEYFDAIAQSVLSGDFLQPARGLVDVFKGEFERAVVHRHEPLRAQVMEHSHGFVRSHVYLAKRIGKISADRQQGDFGFETCADFLKAVKIGAVAGMINTAASVFQNEPAVATMIVPQYAGAPVFAGRQSHFPVAARETFPPFEFDDAIEAQAVSQVVHAPGHHRNFRMRQAAKRWFVKMIEMRVRKQNQVNRREMFDLKPRAFQTL